MNDSSLAASFWENGWRCLLKRVWLTPIRVSISLINFVFFSLLPVCFVNYWCPRVFPLLDHSSSNVTSMRAFKLRCLYSRFVRKFLNLAVNIWRKRIHRPAFYFVITQQVINHLQWLFVINFVLLAHIMVILIWWRRTTGCVKHA